MRVNPNTSADILHALSIARDAQSTAMEQLASGSRIRSWSDDPAASAALVRNRAMAAQNDEFKQNLASIRGQVQMADSSLNSVVLALQRAMAAGVSAGTPGLSAADRNAIAQQVSGIRDEVLSLANTSFEDNYIFGGTAVDTRPFVVDPTMPSGIRYDGNTNTIRVFIGEGVSIQTNVSGSELFVTGNVFESLQELYEAVSDGQGIDAATGAVRTALDHISSQRVIYGNSLAQFDTADELLDRQKLELSQHENDLTGADLTEVVSNFVNAQTVYNALLAAAGKQSQLSLFDYM